MQTASQKRASQICFFPIHFVLLGAGNLFIMTGGGWLLLASVRRATGIFLAWLAESLGSRQRELSIVRMEAAAPTIIDF
jgi:hypothetical protein